MTALVPLNNPDVLPRFKEAGIGEIYLGFHDSAWTERFGDAELNRMSGFGREANPFDFDNMLAHVSSATQMGMSVFVCFNATAYSEEQLEFIAAAYLPKIAEANAAGIIVSNQGLITPARANGIGVVISTVAGVFNERLAAYYRDRGATRVILPRDLSSYEIEDIMRAVPDVEYEVFLMRNGCMFSDSHCLGCHRGGRPSLCMSLREGDVDINLAYAYDAANRIDEIEPGFLERARHNEWLLNMHYHRRTCGLCALWRFERLGVSAYKVVGRGDDADDLCADAALVVRNAALARACETEDEYLARMERPRDPATLCGYEGLSCYYPELARW